MDNPEMKIISLEGNGARPSHMGKGFSEEGTMFTLNTIEQHSVCYCIENHPADSRVTVADDGIVQTLSARMGTGGGNVPLVMIEKDEQDAFVMNSSGDGIAATIDASYYKGQGLRQGIEREYIMLAVDSHPGDSRIGIAGEVSPTVTVKIAKASADGPLVLIRREDENMADYHGSIVCE